MTTQLDTAHADPGAQAGTVSRRTLLTLGGLGVTGWLVGPVALHGGDAAAHPGTRAFVTDYRTNVSTNLTAENNAVVRILSDMSDLWRTGPTWDSGVPIRRDVTRANMRACVDITRRRTDAEADAAFVYDRQHQSYAVTGGLGPFTDAYRRDARAVTSITEAPAGTPPTRISDEVPADAPPGSALGAGSPDSALGSVVSLVDTVRGPFASSNPAKFSFQYPRPWRMNLDSAVVDTGRVDELGYPVYDSPVVVVPSLLRQRSEAPEEDGGFPSGHTNAVWLAAFAFGFAFPERLQSLLAVASEIGHSRIVAGMHSPLDVVGGRTMATALAAATLVDAEHTDLTAQAQADAGAWLAAQPGGDPLAALDRGLSRSQLLAERRRVLERMTYILPRRGPRRELRVPRGAEVLLSTRFPYLSAEQRAAILRSTALPSGYALLDGPEEWGRLDLHAAAAGPGALEGELAVRMEARRGRLHAADRWWGDVAGTGRLVKDGTGTLALRGSNSWSGGTSVRGGTLRAESEHALGDGTVTVDGGTLDVAKGTTVARLRLRQGTVEVGTGRGRLVSEGPLELGGRASLRVRVDRDWSGRQVRVLAGSRLSGRFRSVEASDGSRLEVEHRRDGVYVSRR